MSTGHTGYGGHYCKDQQTALHCLPLPVPPTFEVAAAITWRVVRRSRADSHWPLDRGSALTGRQSAGRRVTGVSPAVVVR